MFGAPKTEWKAGAAAVVITPKQPVWLSGYASRKKPAEGAAQDLYAKALALEDRRGNRTVIVTSDLLGFVRSISEAIAERAAQHYSLKRERLLLTSSHTHSGPVIRESLSGMYDLTPQQTEAIQNYTEHLKEQVVEVIGAALKDLSPARLSFGRGEAGFATNRRAKREKGVVIADNPQGPVDREVPLLKVERADGSLRAVLFSYACHNTTLGGEFYRYHGDYAGEAQAAFERAHPGAIALFMMGTGGDANPSPRGTLELARQHGQSLSAALDMALAGSVREIRGPIKATFDRVPLPFAPLPSREEWQKRTTEGDNVFRQRHARIMLAALDKNGSLPTHYAYPIQVLQLGRDLTLVALAGEVVVDYGLRLKREFGADKLWTVAYANDVFAYVASKRVLEEGGYEADTSMIYYGQPNRWAPEVEDIVVRKVHQLVKKVN